MSSQDPNELLGESWPFLGQYLDEFQIHMLAHSMTQSDSTVPSNCNPENVANIKTPTSRMGADKSENFNLTLETTAEDKQTLKSATTKNSSSCDICSFKASCASSLQTHSRYHSSEKPFNCPNIGCNYKTGWAQDLRRHQGRCRGKIQIPTADTSDEVTIIAVVDKRRSEGTTECSMECGDFTQEEPLHMCTICGFVAYGKQSLQRHLLDHERCQPYRCPIQCCEDCTRRSDNLRQHCRCTNHGKEPQQTPLESKENLGPAIECEAQTDEVDVNNSSLGFA